MRIEKPIIRRTMLFTICIIFFIISNLFLLNYLYSKQSQEQEGMNIEMFVENTSSMIDYVIEYRLDTFQKIYDKISVKEYLDYSVLKITDRSVLEIFIHTKEAKKNKYCEYVEKMFSGNDLTGKNEKTFVQLENTKEDENVLILTKFLSEDKILAMVLDFGFIMNYFVYSSYKNTNDFSYIMDLDTDTAITLKGEKKITAEHAKENKEKHKINYAQKGVFITKYDDIICYNKIVNKDANIIYVYAIPRKILSEGMIFNFSFLIIAFINILFFVIFLIIYINYRIAQNASYIDNLTGIYNRRYFHNVMKNIIKKKKFPFSLIMLDMNYLKLINDTEGYGHTKGDEALVRLANTLKSVFRDNIWGKEIMSSRENDIVARIGGDEFAVILPFTTQDSASMLIERINSSLSEMNYREPSEFPVSVASGFITVTDASISEEEIYAAADKAMYANKRAGREKSYAEIEKWKKKNNVV